MPAEEEERHMEEGCALALERSQSDPSPTGKSRSGRRGKSGIEEKAHEQYGAKFFKEFERRLKQLSDTKPWTIANRIRLIMTSRWERPSRLPFFIG
eukprot:220526-Prorocentrum_minimum.AAC.1